MNEYSEQNALVYPNGPTSWGKAAVEETDSSEENKLFRMRMIKLFNTRLIKIEAKEGDFKKTHQARKRDVSATTDRLIPRLQESIMLGLKGKGVLSELDAVYAECSQPNWDGYGALSVFPETYSNARSFLDSLSMELPAPTVGAEPDGHLTLEWYSSGRKTLSVSIAPDGNLHYAAIIGPITRYGTEPIGTHASVIEDLIRQVMTT